MFIASQPLVGFTCILKVFLSASFKFGIVYTLAYRCFRICSDWTKFNQELRFLKGVFLKNGYPLGFIDSCFKKVIDNVLTESSVKLTVEKHLLISPFPFLEDISLQLRTKLRKSFKNILNCCKVQIVYKSQRRLSSQFHLKEPFPYDFCLKLYINICVEDAIFPITVRWTSILG